ncbi:hypothetical protein M8494_27915 [Serratia ureilytica]
MLRTIADFRHDVDSTITPRGRDVLDQLMPRLLAEVCPRRRADRAGAAAQLLLSIVTRTTYLERAAHHRARSAI